MDIITESDLDNYLELCAFSLMPNHYHFLVKQISAKPVSSWIQYIFIRYVKFFNNKYKRQGTIFESNVKAKLIDRIEYIGNITHYIHNNPDSEMLIEYSSINFLDDKTIVNLGFYKDFFNDVPSYLAQFENYKSSMNDKKIDAYLFG